VILSNSTSLPEPQKLVARLAKALDDITNPSARASVFWLVGQFATSDEKGMLGLGWEGVAPWVPDVLRKGVKGFTSEVGLSDEMRMVTADGTSRLSPSCRSLHSLRN
jgi:AP-3 complex subunit beta